MRTFSFSHHRAKCLTLFALLFLPLSCLRAQGNAILILWHADGSQTNIELYTLPQISFVGGCVLITSDVLTLEFPKDDVLRFTFKGSETGIHSPQTDADYSIRDGQIVFRGISSSDRVAVYTTSGIRVPVHLTVSGTSLSLPLADISSGVYILSVNGRTSKFTKR